MGKSKNWKSIKKFEKKWEKYQNKNIATNIER